MRSLRLALSLLQFGPCKSKQYMQRPCHLIPVNQYSMQSLAAACLARVDEVLGDVLQA